MTGPRSPVRPAASASRVDAVERLYVYWILSTGLLLILAVILALFVRAAVQETRALAGRVKALEATLVQHKPVAPNTPAPPEAAPAAATRPTPAPPATVPAATRPATGAPPAGAAPPAVPVTRSDEDMRTAAETAVQRDVATGYLVPDPAAARTLLQAAAEQAARARWSGPTFARLAVLARLLERDALAEDLARRAVAAGDPAAEFAHVSARSLLARGRTGEALVFARQYVEHSDGAPAAILVLAEALLATDQPGAASEALAALTALRALDAGEKLRLGRVALALEHYRTLDEVLGSLDAVPDPLTAERNFLEAVSLARRDRTVEALAVLDFLAAEAAPAADPRRPWPIPRPTAYEVAVWRGVTLMYAGQMESAREALDAAAQLDPGRPEANFFRGVLEANAGRSDVARTYLKNALAGSARLAPAWEALATLDLEADRIEAALESLARAVEINPRRATAHLLRAIAHAKLSQAEPAAAALRVALRLDPSLLTEARQVDVFKRLFTPAELEALAADGADGEPP